VGATFCLGTQHLYDRLHDNSEHASEQLAAIGARVALLNGSLHAEPLPDGRTRLVVGLPLQAAPASTLEPAGSVARTTVLPDADSTSS
jgi:hypothetical protein